MTSFGTLQGSFEGNSKDETNLQLEDVGVLSKIEIKKDDAGNGPDWYPSTFSVTVNGRSYSGTNDYWVNTATAWIELR